MNDFVFELHNLNTLCPILWQIIEKNPIVLFDAPMGVGKTTLIKHLCQYKNTLSDVNSPSFAIVNEYLLPNNQKIYHLDLYRLKNEEEVFLIGITDILDSNAFCFIEWGEKALPFLPPHYITFQIHLHPQHPKRILKIIYT